MRELEAVRRGIDKRNSICKSTELRGNLEETAVTGSQKVGAVAGMLWQVELESWAGPPQSARRPCCAWVCVKSPGKSQRHREADKQMFLWENVTVTAGQKWSGHIVGDSESEKRMEWRRHHRPAWGRTGHGESSSVKDHSWALGCSAEFTWPLFTVQAALKASRLSGFSGIQRWVEKVISQPSLHVDWR